MHYIPLVPIRISHRSDGKAERALAMLARGMFQSDIAKELGITRQYVSMIASPLKCYARQMVGNAIRSGQLVPPTDCSSCGSTGNVHGHHSNYMEPLNVTWLCSRCHGEAHYGRRVPKKKRVLSVATFRPKSEAAVMMGRKRWENVSVEERRAHAMAMVASRRLKRVHLRAKTKRKR